ncbi:catechol 2,3-dioxygenase [Deinococcus metalli]|uniref:Catechol 2,3-dioxygenase n=1 Tax=Deinococcus metalli TaxID=1141878 RepID=A0A7W8NQD5_9DEIO|nr:VOC family protein [Deinococcus metalli]MBB5378934.1 catechol 2,3-dioxygenase [Deinococcus metalli]GHF62854.1 glyoxalase [Deinococcus metalli]
MTTTPVLPATTHVGPVTLLARDLAGLSAFYQRLLGLKATAQTAAGVTLAAHGTPLLHLQAAPELPAASVSRPGLYHTAFLLPTRADLGRWLAHAARLGLRIGSGDHLVSEAFYLTDPEGNGIEVYADRPRDTWTWRGGQVQMDTLAVDGAAVLHAAGIDPQRLDAAAAYAGAPAGTSVGHVHLKVGNAAQAARFYTDALGLDVVADMGSAAFLSWGGYHHHLGVNEWHTAGHGRPAAPAAGLGGVDFVTEDLGALRAHLAGRDGVTDTPDGVTFHDPWGNRVTVRQA